MERWHRCSRWTEKKLPCPYGGLELGFEEGEDAIQRDPAVTKETPLSTTAKEGQATATPSAVANTVGSTAAQVDSPLHKLIEDDVSIKERAIPGAGPVPLWGDTFPVEVAKTWTTPTLEHGMSDVLYANPKGPAGITTMPLVGIKQGVSTSAAPPLDPLLPEPNKSAVRPTSKGFSGEYPLMEAQLALAMAGKTPPASKVIAIGREAPISIEQDTWEQQSQIAIVAGAMAVASLTTATLHPGNVAAHMEKVITKSIPDKTVKAEPKVQTKIKVSTGGGPAVRGSGGRTRSGGMKGGAFQTESIWDPQKVGGGGSSVVEGWEKELKRVSQDSHGFSGLLG